MTLTLATPANMRRAAEQHPGKRIVAISLNGQEEWSATAGDYWNVGDDEPILDVDDEPCVLAYPQTTWVDALTGETL